jgi:hypothetical protein
VPEAVARVAGAHTDSFRADIVAATRTRLMCMASWIVNLIVTGTAVGIGAIGVGVIGEAGKSKPIPVKVRKERRR